MYSGGFFEDVFNGIGSLELDGDEMYESRMEGEFLDGKFHGASTFWEE